MVLVYTMAGKRLEKRIVMIYSGQNILYKDVVEHVGYGSSFELQNNLGSPSLRDEL